MNPAYLVPFGAQLGPEGGRTGGVDCTAWAMSRLIAAVTSGTRTPTGRIIRLRSSEPVPDPRSPGLNLSQVHDVAWGDFGTWTDVHVGSRALTWAQYEALRRDGHPMVVQVGYAPIADSPYDAGRGFRGGHAIYEDRSQTIDSLADGRASGVYAYQRPTLYPRGLMREAAASLILGYDAKGRPIRTGPDRVWCAIGRDTAPPMEVRIKPRRGHRLRRLRVFAIRSGVITHYDVRTVMRPLAAPCSAPRTYRWPTRDNALRTLVKVDNPGGKLDGKWIRYRWADSTAADTGGDPELGDDLDLLDLDDPDEPVPDVRNDPVEEWIP